MIDILPEQKKVEGLGGNMRLGGKDIELTPGSLISSLYHNALTQRLRFRHRYEVDPRYFDTLKKHGLIFSGRHPRQPIMQMLELPREVHPYFVGTQAHPCLTSRPLTPDGMFLGLVKAALRAGVSTRCPYEQRHCETSAARNARDGDDGAVNPLGCER